MLCTDDDSKSPFGALTFLLNTAYKLSSGGGVDLLVSIKQSSFDLYLSSQQTATCYATEQVIGLLCKPHYENAFHCIVTVKITYL